MSTPVTLLQTKLDAPSLRPGLVQRPRLTARLDAGLTSRLSLVVAPAGFGKTTLVGEWVHTATRFLLDHQPPSLHLVLVGREDPPLPLPRLRGRGQMVEIRATDLRFTLDVVCHDDL